MTRPIRFYPLCLLAIFLTGCGISRNISDLQTIADESFVQENYQDALDYYGEIIDLKIRHKNEISGNTYYRAGISAWELQQTGKALEYLEQARRRNFTNERSIYILADAYRHIDNLSLEITSLEYYVDSYPEGERINEVRKRLFESYLVSNNHGPAMELWPDLEESATRNAALLEKYFILNSRLENEDELKVIAKQLNSLDGDNTVALRYLGEHHFWKAENRYQEELTAYEKNQTRQQYRQLLNALNDINEQFRVSRDFLEHLWNIMPSPQTATYLRNIYVRFGNEGKAEYYHKNSNIE